MLLNLNKIIFEVSDMDLKITIPKTDVHSTNITQMTTKELEIYISQFTTFDSIHKQCLYIQKMMILEEQSLLRYVSPKEHRQNIVHFNQIFKALITVKHKMLYEK
jgi:hypothetical protein